MVTEADVLAVLRTVNDPEMPISIVELGIVDAVHVSPTALGRAAVGIEVLPTFVGCPALPVIEDEIRKKVSRLADVADVRISFKFSPAWTVDRISAAGRESLRKFGITVPGAELDAPPRCPVCGSTDVRLESSFGPTRCRMIYHCEACLNPFEHLKRVSLPTLTITGGSANET
jgi:ring-1,2-phenylacetyl-CoA epoxidase subunit PaaD